MKSFHRKKINVRKQEQGDRAVIYLDLFRANAKSELKYEIIRDILEDKLCLAVIDSKLAYKRGDLTERLEVLYQFLEQKSYSYRKVVLTEEYAANVLGIQIRLQDKKVAHHIVGIVLSAEKLQDFLAFNKLNVSLYPADYPADPEELLDCFQAARGDTDMIKEDYRLRLFLDEFMSVLRLDYPKSLAESIDQLLAPYASSI